MHAAPPQRLCCQTFTHHNLAQSEICWCCNAQVSEVPGNACQLMLPRYQSALLLCEYVGLRRLGKFGAFQQHLVPRPYGWRRVHDDFAADYAGALLALFIMVVFQPPLFLACCVIAAQRCWLAVQVRFHKYVVLHFLGSALCIASLPRLGAALEVAVPQWTAAAFVQFGVALHTTLVLFVPLASNRLIMRSERRLFVNSDERLYGSISGGYGHAKHVARA